MEEYAEALVDFLREECQDLMIDDLKIERGDGYVSVTADGCFDFTDYTVYNEPNEPEVLSRFIKRASSVKVERGTDDVRITLVFRDE